MKKEKLLQTKTTNLRNISIQGHHIVLLFRGDQVVTFELKTDRYKHYLRASHGICNK